jgi:hypothetical protein
MIIGIDYSITCPAVCVLAEDESFQNSKFFFLTDTYKHTDLALSFPDQISTELHKPYKDQQERFDHISNSVISFIESIPSSGTLSLWLEDYAMGAKGRVFHIGEATGLLKHKIHQHPHWSLNTVAPTTMKKFATGKGNVQKPRLYEALVKDQGHPILKTFIDDWYKGDIEKVRSPISDMIDAYWLARYGADSFLQALITSG